MKKKNILQKLSSGKGFYITAAISFGLMIVAIIAVYRTSTGMLMDILTTSPDEGVTQQVRRNETDETDPRYTTEPTTITTAEQQTTSKEYETSITWQSTEKNSTDATTTTEEITQAVISNDSYVLPITTDIQREYYPSSPVYDETMGDWRVHKGIDFSGDRGCEVKSVGNGKVTKVISDTSWGYVVEIDHGDFIGRYCGLEQGTTVKANEAVAKGDIIGKLAVIPCEAGQQPHLHFEAVKDGNNTDPLEVMKITAE